MSQDRKQPRVFVVDDEPAISSTFTIILRNEGFVSRSMNAPRQVLQAAQFDVPDLLITDIAMPEMSGELAIDLNGITQTPNSFYFRGTLTRSKASARPRQLDSLSAF